jgi:flagellar capping protein FliD
VEEDKTMITERIKEEVGISSYNEQVRQFLEQQYKFVALRSRGRQTNNSGGANGHTGLGSSSADHLAGGDSIGGDGLAEVLKHLRRLNLRLGSMEKKQEEVAKEVAKKQEEMAKQQEEVSKKQEEMAKKQEEMAKHQQAATSKQEAIKKELGVVASQLGAVEKNQHGMMARERPWE